MPLRARHHVAHIVCNVFFCFCLCAGQARKSSPVDVPRTWDDAAMSTLELPLATPAASPKHVSADYYYRIPIRPIYKQYPVYAPGKEPKGYWEWLQNQDPVIVWDEGQTRPSLETASDWIRAGEMVFDSPAFVAPDRVISVDNVRNRQWYEDNGFPVTQDGVVPFVSYVVRQKGKVELGTFSCAMCHTRVMTDGTVIKGAQGNFPVDQVFIPKQFTEDRFKILRRGLYATPWLNPDPLDEILAMPPDQLNLKGQWTHPGVITRHRTNPVYPVQVPDLIGVKERRYLDRTGLQQQRSIVDLMRYAALNQGGDGLADFGGFIPLGGPRFDTRPEPTNPALSGRYSDEQLYALARYVYSLVPPSNPNKFDATAAHGQKVFEREGCPACHTPPLYTNNKLTLAEGFTPSPEAAGNDAILPLSVGTDPGLTTKTRRGTGYYKVPSLKGVWYRSMFGHSGWCATLEDWFDPHRIQSNYIPTGFKPNGNAPYPVKGHPFGLDLDDADRKALIAFLKTL